MISETKEAVPYKYRSGELPSTQKHELYEGRHEGKEVRKKRKKYGCLFYIFETQNISVLLFFQKFTRMPPFHVFVLPRGDIFWHPNNLQPYKNIREGVFISGFGVRQICFFEQNVFLKFGLEKTGPGRPGCEVSLTAGGGGSNDNPMDSKQWETEQSATANGTFKISEIKTQHI